ncbi:hypothetical protein NL108_013059 [Boleophthalmus pectinirostris]|nr:hypothetical protein NL108_013059 [Boleophthalmus pectinirostris]
MRSLCAIILIMVLCVLGSRPITGQDMSAAQLTQLYNRRVLVAEKMTRLKDGWPSWTPHIYATTHSGVRVTLQGTSTKYLIHKGPKNSGSGYQTIITDARHMLPNWTLERTVNYNGRVSVGDMIRAGGAVYNVLTNNCHQAADAMLAL